MSATCPRAGCGKPSYLGQPGQFCSKTCLFLATGSSPQAPLQPASNNGQQQVMCVRRGCGKPSWNGKEGKFCSLSCRDAGPACATPGCGKPSWNGEAGQFCSPACRDAAGALPGVKASPGTQVCQSKFDDLQAQFQVKWKGGTPPKIASIWHVHNDQLIRQHLDYCERRIGSKVPVKPPGKNPGNQQRRFHATALLCNFSGTPCSTAGCNVCSIIKTGFSMTRAKGGLYGKGIYSSSTPSKAFSYGNRRGMFVVGVAVGVADVSSGTGPLPPNCHSRVVNNSNDELIVFDEAAIVPKYLIVFA